MFTATTEAGTVVDLTPEHGVWSVRSLDGLVECDHYDVLTWVSDFDEFAEFCCREFVFTRDLMRDYHADLSSCVERQQWTDVGRSALAIAGLSMRSALIRDTLILAELHSQSAADSKTTAEPVIEPTSRRFRRLRQRLSSLIRGGHA